VRSGKLFDASTPVLSSDRTPATGFHAPLQIPAAPERYFAGGVVLPGMPGIPGMVLPVPAPLDVPALPAPELSGALPEEPDAPEPAPPEPLLPELSGTLPELLPVLPEEPVAPLPPPEEPDVPLLP
jgi:hypothetical protein